MSEVFVVDLEKAHERAMIELSDKHPDLHARSVDMTESTIMKHLYALGEPLESPAARAREEGSE